jgi:hypothetical protein
MSEVKKIVILQRWPGEQDTVLMEIGPNNKDDARSILEGLIRDAKETKTPVMYSIREIYEEATIGNNQIFRS